MLSTFRFYTWGQRSTEVLVKLLVRERDAFRWAYLSILGKRFEKRPCRLLGGKYSFSMPSLKKVNKIKHVTYIYQEMSSVFHMFCFISLKRKSMRMVLSTFPFYGWGKGGTEAWMKLTSHWKRCLLVRYLLTLCKIHENVLWLSWLWGNTSRFQFCLLRKN